MVTGKVFKVYTKEWQGKTLYTIKIDGDPKYYRCGEKDPGSIAGKTVSFAVKKEEATQATVDGKITATADSGKSGGASPGTGVDWAKKDASIQYQSSRKDALELVKLLIASTALKLPKAQADIAGVIEAAVDHYTSQFFEDIGSLAAVARANGIDPKETVAQDEKGEDEEDED